MIWLHGWGDRGEDNSKQLTWINVIFEANGDHPPLFILVPQHHLNEHWLEPAEGQPHDALWVTNKILQELLVKYSIDRDRVYVVGISSGGYATWEFAIRHADRIAAAAPMSSAFGRGLSSASKLSQVPICAFNSAADKRSPAEHVRPLTDAIRQAGGSAELIETDGDGLWYHDSWTRAFKDYHLLDWLLAQRRGQPATPFPSISAASKALIWFKRDGWVPTVWLAILTGTFFVWRYSRRGIPAIAAASGDLASPAVDQVPSGAP
jgi:predicted peptidase